ncbi:hypothetical protein TL16_g03341 [Triparma laevis f. inornata]|uniref:Uncharacterized protein n=1 Tax=Triparma laevis f. inornata TaxID=1714386 RepID=A0A9W7A2P7_9STRA|nr:hypothetical protein TL16_g03341 [Triparma laevis f. inornata]
MDLFRNYCDVYFNKSDGAASQQNVETASSVLNALSNLLQGLQPTDGLPSIHEDAIRDCGLLSPDVDVSAYTKIQDDVRRAIHQRKMAERREAFSRLLDSNKTSTVVPSGSAETSTTSSSSSSIKGKVLTLSQLSQVKSSTQLFSQRYMSKQTTSGVQAFIGGLREVRHCEERSDELGMR